MAGLYTGAASILRKLESKEGTLKSLIYSDKIKDKKFVTRLVLETLKCKNKHYILCLSFPHVF